MMLPAVPRSSLPQARPRASALLLALLLTAGSAHLARAAELSLDQALALLEQNRNYRAKTFELKGKEAQEITAGLWPNPTATYAPSRVNPITRADQSIAVGQTIELGGKRRLRVESARADTRATRFQVQDFERQIKYQVKSTFVAALTAKATVAFVTGNLSTLSEIERLQKLRANRGDISELELNRLQGQRYDVESAAADARQAYDNAAATLRTIAPDRIPERFDVAGNLEYRPLAIDRAQLAQRALANRPDVQAAAAAQDKAKIDVDLAKANAIPDITPSLGYTRTGDHQNIYGFSLSVPLPVFDRNQGEIARTAAEASRLNAVQEATKVQALADLDLALAAYAAARDKLEALRATYLAKAKDVRDRVENAYRRGALSLLDYLDAERTYRQTTQSYLQALGDYWTAIYQIEAASGGPVDQGEP